MNELIPIVLSVQLRLGAAALPAPVPPPPVDVAAAAVPAPEDRWFAEDKARHFALSLGTTALAFGGLRVAGLDRPGALLGAAAAGAAAGLWKERRDLRLTGRFSGRDLVWDAAGIVAGLAIAGRTR